MAQPLIDPTAVGGLGPQVGLIVHSHLRWDFVWQRPQQILSRIARDNPVLFVEEPLLLDDVAAPSLSLSMPHDGVFRALPELPRQLGERYDEGIAVIRELVSGALAGPLLSGRFRRVVQWFYTPMPAPEMLGAFDEEGVVYDCMDELAKFRFAPADIGRRERLLLSRADIVFTGGHRLYEAKSRYHDDVHFFGCGVDAQHFSAARRATTVVPADAAALPRPVLGYFGVVDERLDYDLIRAVATARPEWTLLFIGPVVKVDPAELPRLPNVHWLGQRRYEELPAYVRGFDVCLMPFALNEATEFINPTKTLEYMASGRPIVSTPVADVVRNFGDVVYVVRDADAFVAAVEGALAHPDEARLAAGLARAAEASWESIVRRMRGLIGAAMGARAVEPVVDEAIGRVVPAIEASARRAARRHAAPLDVATETGTEAT